MSHQQTLSGRAWIELLLLALIWGGSFLAFAIALREIPVFTVVAHRLLWAAILLWVIAIIQKWPLPPRRLWLPCLVMGVLNNAIPFSLIAWGQLHVESGLASIFNASTAIFGALVAASLFADERMTARKITGITLGFLGVIWAIGPDSLQSFDPRSLAQLAIIAASLSYAFASSWARKTLAELDGKTAALGMLTGSSLVMVCLARVVDGPPGFDLLAETWGAIIYISLAATAVAYMLYYRVLAAAGASNLMLVTLIIPPIAIILGAFVLNETLTANAFIGLGIIAAGMLVLDGRIVHFVFSKG